MNKLVVANTIDRRKSFVAMLRIMAIIRDRSIRII